MAPIAPAGPCGPVAPRGMVKSSTWSGLPDTSITAASVPGSPVLVLRTVMVSAVPASPVAPVGPVGPTSPGWPCGPWGPLAPSGPCSPLGPLIASFSLRPGCSLNSLYSLWPYFSVGPAGPIARSGLSPPVGPVDPVAPVGPRDRERLAAQSDPEGRARLAVRWGLLRRTGPGVQLLRWDPADQLDPGAGFTLSASVTATTTTAAGITAWNEIHFYPYSHCQHGIFSYQHYPFP